MTYINEHKALHKLAEKATLSHSWRDTSSWGLISELVRRQPENETFLIYECPYVAGIPHTVWYLNAPSPQSSQGETKIRINNFGHVHINEHGAAGHRCPINEYMDTRNDSILHALDFILSPNPKQLTLEVEGCYRKGAILPHQAPATRSNTIGGRVIATSLALFLHTKSPLRVTGYLYDGNDPRTDLVEYFPPLLKEIAENAPDLDQVFFIREHAPERHDDRSGEPGIPIVAIDLKTGMAFTKSTELDLLTAYQGSGRNIESLSFQLVLGARKP